MAPGRGARSDSEGGGRRGASFGGSGLSRGLVEGVIARVRSTEAGSALDHHLATNISLREVDGGIEVRASCPFAADRFKRRLLGHVQSALQAEAGGAAGQGRTASLAIVVGAPSEHDAPDRTKAPIVRREPVHTVTPRVSPTERRRVPTAGRRSADHSLESYLVGPSNRLAFDTVRRMATGEAPIGLEHVLVHGESGVGKSHLLEGLADAFERANPGSRVRRISAEEFISGFVHAVQNNTMDAFRRRLRRVDLLCIDDVHVLAGKSGSQAELVHTFDALRPTGARIVMASDAPPTAIGSLSAALASRLRGAAVLGIEAPDADLRRRLIAARAARLGYALSHDSVAMIDAELELTGQRRRGSITARDIEGAVTQIIATVRLMPELLGPDGSISAAAIQRALGHRDRTRSGRAPLASRVSVSDIAATVAASMGVSANELSGRGRHKRVVLARAVTIFLCRKLSTRSYPEIAQSMGRTAHSFAVMAHQRVTKQIRDGEMVEVGCPHDGLTVGSLCEVLEREVVVAGSGPGRSDRR
ncbi:MAG: hypothetical protein CMJ31_14970 [Phycisphaerae bacterium]|nr:hypothetical protein [Phycisphaerae bacterium]